MRISLSIFSLALYVHFASFASAVPAIRSDEGVNKLSDANLFEAHLQQAATSHKRLPSEVISHHDRNDPAASAMTSTVAPTLLPDPTASVISSSPKTARSDFTFIARQPSHFIKHRTNRQHKKRFADVVDTSEQDTQSLASVSGDEQVGVGSGLETSPEIVLALSPVRKGESRASQGLIMIDLFVDTQRNRIQCLCAQKSHEHSRY